jgi:hypothetical protein
MNKFLLLLLLFLSSVFSIAQNVGIGTAAPNEKLDVNGNVNVSGQLKLNGNAGNAGQVLMKDASNNPVWGDVSEFKNMVVLDCAQINGGGGAGNCSNSWTVPAGITKILVECWGGGGGGCSVSGGGGGGYISAKFTVTAGNMASIQIGAGGVAGTPSTFGQASAGGTSLFSINGMAIFANGGGAGYSPGNPNYTITLTQGGSFFTSGMADNFFGTGGSGGRPSSQTFAQVSATIFADIQHFGDGGDAALLPGSGSKGGYFSSYNGTFQTAFSVPSLQAGGGGGSDYYGGSNGCGGRVIIHY